MLEKFWESFLSNDPVDMEYIHDVDYPSEEIFQEVKEKLDWMIVRLIKVKEQRRMDYQLVDSIRNKILLRGYSLTSSGVDYLNLIIQTLEQEAS